jgi:TonB family protein
MKAIKPMCLIIFVLMMGACATEHKRTLKAPHTQSVNIFNRTVKVDLGDGRSGQFKKQEIDLDNYNERLKGISFKNIDGTPKPISLQMPIYPPSLKQRKIEGFAEVVFVIDESGFIESLRVIDSSHREFAEAAAAAIIQWRFEPMTKNGEATKVSLKQRFPFVLQ